MEIIGLFATRTQAARKAVREDIKAFQSVRMGNQGWRLVTMPDQPGLDAAIAYAKTCDWINHVEVKHIDEGREPGYRLVLVVSCFRSEIPVDEIPEGLELEPITPQLWESDDKEGPFEHRARFKPVKTEGAPRAKSDIESPTKFVWNLADEQKIEGELTKADRARIIEMCIAAGVNKSTAQTQLYKWAKANGK